MKGISIGWIPRLTTWAELSANVLFWCMKREIEIEGATKTSKKILEWERKKRERKKKNKKN